MSQYITERNKMNIEEAKENIGKEVVYIGDETPCLKGIIFTIVSVDNNLIYVNSNDFCIRAKAFLLKLKHPTFKAGDQVVLDESTKPYTLTDMKGEIRELSGEPSNNKKYTVKGIDVMGDAYLADFGYINPRHLKLAPQQEVKLPEFKVKEVQPSTNQYLKDVTDLLQSLDVSFVVKEDDLAFTVVYADNEERISKSCVRSLSWAYGLVIAEEAGKESEFIEMYGKLVECSTLLRKAGHKVKTTMRGIEVL